MADGFEGGIAVTDVGIGETDTIGCFFDGHKIVQSSPKRAILLLCAVNGLSEPEKDM